MSTPRIVVHQNLQDPSGNLWQSIVALYQDARYADLIYRDDAPGGNGKQVSSAVPFLQWLVGW